jgi:hypothetical protein
LITSRSCNEFLGDSLPDATNYILCTIAATLFPQWWSEMGRFDRDTCTALYHDNPVTVTYIKGNT